MRAAITAEKVRDFMASQPEDVAGLDGTRLRYYLMDRAAHLSDVIALGRGDPDFHTPGPIVEAAVAQMGEWAGHPPVRGLLELRAAVAQKLARDNAIHVDPDAQILITNGGQEALFLAILALVNPGDEVMVSDPRYSSYDDAVATAGGSMILVPTSREKNFDLDPGDVEKAITPRSKLLLVITPSNPTAGVISPANLRGLAEVAKTHNLFVISDEIYEKITFDEAHEERLSITTLSGMAERTLTLNAVSKAYAMTGWRLGYAAGPAWLIDAMARLKRVCSRASSAVSQWAALAALRGSQDAVEGMRREYDERRRLLMATLDGLGFTYGHPYGGYYIWTDIGSTGVKALDMSLFLLEKARVLVFPGTAFGDRWSDYMRISYVLPTPKLREALDRIRTALA
jgi:aminotransferase